MRRTIVMAIAGLMSLTAAAWAGETENKDRKNKNTKEMKTIQITKEDFVKKVADYEATGGKWKYLGDKPAIVDFYADWCGPCRMLAPVLEELAAEYEGEIYVYKVDTQSEEELASVFGIRSIPSILFIPMEGQPQMSQGAMPKDALAEVINDVLLKDKEVKKN